MSNESKGNASAVHPSIQPLFTPFTIGKLTLPNRIVMAPMTRTFSPNGMPGADVAQYYRRRGENGVGLIITEGTVINHPSSADHPNVPQFYGPALDGWSSVVEQVHAAGGDDALIQPYSGHESRKSLEVYSKLAITDAQFEYNEVINKTNLIHTFAGGVSYAGITPLSVGVQAIKHGGGETGGT